VSLAIAANKLFEQGGFVDAWLVYELLQQWRPQFAHQIGIVREALGHQSDSGAKLAAKTTIHSDVSTDLQKRLRVAHAVSALGEEALVNDAFAGVPPSKIPPELWLARANSISTASRKGWWGEWLTRVNRYLNAYSLPPLTLLPKQMRASDALYMNLEAASPKRETGPLVSIHMSCFNAETTVELAIRSLQAQSHVNFELLIFDDCSSDNTASIVRRLAQSDSRIRFVENTCNQGAYTNRNQALQQARGEFFTVHDSDDFALPHRLAWAVNHLESNPAHIAVVGQWLRVNERGHFLFKSGWGGVYQHVAVATLMLRRKQAVESIGYWDSVRFAADTEYLERLKLVYGEQNIPVATIPVALALSHPGSLTNHPTHGIDVNDKEGWSPVRSEYARAWKRWHAKNVAAAGKGSDASLKLRALLYMPFPATQRPFKVPDALLSSPVQQSATSMSTLNTDSLEDIASCISRGNTLWRSGDLDSALREYRKLKPNARLFSHAQFNIRMIERAQQRGQSSVPDGKPSSRSARDNRADSLCLSVKDGPSDCPLLSIIMPVYNVAPYLDTAIVSALNQHCADFELIIVNDASTDGCRKIIDMHASQDARIRVVHLEHNTLGGAGIPSNIGLCMARGQYIGFIDSDDWVTADAFEKMLTLASDFDADVVIGDFRTFTEDGRVVSPAYDGKRYEGPLNQVVNVAEAPSLLRLSAVPWRKIYKRSFMQEHAIAYPEGDYFYEDNPLHWFVLTRAKRVIVTPQVVSYHRMGREGQTMSSNAYKLSSMTSHINSILKFVGADSSSLLNANVVTDELWRFWHGAKWIVKRQSQQSAESLIKKRLSQLAERISKLAPAPADIASKLDEERGEYVRAYPDVDLTIVIAAYNAADVIGETIDSVLKLDGLRYNVLIIDDGSTDETLEILQTYEKDHANVHVFQQGNRGAGRARNMLIPLCTGTYTYFLDADDTIDAAALAHAVKAAIANEDDLTFFKYRIDYVDQGKSRGMFDSDAKLWMMLSPQQSISEQRAALSSLINYPWNRVIRTRLLHDANVFFGPTVVHNDIPYHWLSIVAAKKIGYVDVEVCTHKKFSERAQITNVMDERRMGLFEALRYTQERLTPYAEFSDIRESWVKFATHLLDWAKDRIEPGTHQEFERRKERFISNLTRLDEISSISSVFS